MRTIPVREYNRDRHEGTAVFRFVRDRYVRRLRNYVHNRRIQDFGCPVINREMYLFPAWLNVLFDTAPEYRVHMAGMMRPVARGAKNYRAFSCLSLLDPIIISGQGFSFEMVRPGEVWEINGRLAAHGFAGDPDIMVSNRKAKFGGCVMPVLDEDEVAVLMEKCDGSESTPAQVFFSDFLSRFVFDGERSWLDHINDTHVSENLRNQNQGY